MAGVRVKKPAGTGRSNDQPARIRKRGEGRDEIRKACEGRRRSKQRRGLGARLEQGVEDRVTGRIGQMLGCGCGGVGNRAAWKRGVTIGEQRSKLSRR
jgi:hypothetical protein